MNRLALAIVTVLSLPLATYAESSHHWTYQGKTGPEEWSKLSKDFVTCATGRQQSPIDITEAIKAELPALQFDYKPIPLTIENNGHTIKVDGSKNSGGEVKIGKDSYQLVQFHTHTPSEEAIEGKRAEMDVHLVHQDKQGHLAVVALLFNAGESNPALEIMAEHAPKQVGKPVTSTVTIDVNQLLPQNKGYYTYWGSFTTPPCTEGVRWFVLKQGMTASASQLGKLKALHPNNARPLQPVANRYVLSSSE